MTFSPTQISSCPLCDAEVDVVAHGRIAPFIAELSHWSAGSEPRTDLCACSACDFTFFSHRYSDETMESLYAGYRGSEYLAVRKKWEPWYSDGLNGALAPGTAAVTERTAFMVKGLHDIVDIAALRNIVDYGGDAGQFFPPDYQGPKYVIDVSGREVVPGVRAISSLQDVDRGRPQLVVAAHLLEHVADPVGLLIEIREQIAADGFIYVEVPMDRPRVRRWHKSALYNRALSAARSTRLTWILADFISGASRNMGWRVPRFGAVKQSEHINYFSEESLIRVLTQAGFATVQMTADPTASLQGLRLGRLGAVAIPALPVQQTGALRRLRTHTTDIAA